MMMQIFFLLIFLIRCNLISYGSGISFILLNRALESSPINVCHGCHADDFNKLTNKVREFN